MRKRIHSLLKKNNLSITTGREEILHLFFKEELALSYNDIEKKSGHKLNRVTVYRTLATFVRKGILYTIPTADQYTLYALRKDINKIPRHNGSYVYFLCDNCKQTFSFEPTEISDFTLPDDYNIQRINLVLEGLCKTCNNQ